jgi:hypothetical protein
MSDVDQVKYLCRHLGVSEEELLRAVEKLGNSISAARKELASPIVVWPVYLPRRPAENYSP